jgi:hypothetical protein
MRLEAIAALLGHQKMEMLAFLASWLSGSENPVLRQSLAAFAGHPAYNTDTLCADLHKFAVLLGETDGQELFGEQAR